MNPVPVDIKPRILSTAINEDDGTASLALAMEIAGYFGLSVSTAGAITAKVGQAVSQWRDEATRYGLTKAEIDRMVSAFEHRDLEMARMN
jgi:serine/threonine-protein kinase HipA